MNRSSAAAVLAVFLLALLGPFAYLVAVSVSSEGAGGLSFEAYTSVLGSAPFLRSLANSAFVAIATTVLCLIVGAGAGFALARIEFRGRRVLLAIALAVSMFPPIATVSPLFLLLRSVGLRDSLVGLVLPDATFALPLTLWLLTAFFRELPPALYQAARVDGCSPFGAFWRVYLPLALPGIATTGILVFLFAWNEFLFALTFISSPEKRTVPVAIALFASGFKEPWREIAAASVIATLPLLVAVLALQRRIVQGLTAGAVKG